jgi:hypothetical protein
LSDAALRAFANAVPRADFRDDEGSLVNDFRMKEDSDAFYLQLKGEAPGQQWVAGLRHERLKFSADGFGLRDDELETVRRPHHAAAIGCRPCCGARTSSADTRWRAALTSSVVRPSLRASWPRALWWTATRPRPATRCSSRCARATGIWASSSRLGRDGALSAYLFAKQIKDFSFRTELAGSGAWPGFDSVESYANGDKARVHGLELSWQQVLRGWAGGSLVLGANASLVRSKARIGGFDDGEFVTRQIALPSQSDRTLNLSLGWEGSALSLRLALNHKSRYLLEVGDLFDASKDQFVDAQNQVDLSLRYTVNKQWQLGFEALNLSNAKYDVYQGNPARNVQYEQYGRAYKLNLKWSGL